MATQDQIANHCDTSRQTVSKLLPAFGLPSKGCGIDDFRIAYIRHLREVAAGRKSDNVNTEYDLMEERARLSHHQANKTELEEGILRGELIEVESVINRWSAMISVFRSRLLSLPSKAAQVVSSVSDVHKNQETLSEYVYEALNELAGNGLADEINKRRYLADSEKDSSATT